MRHLLIDHSRLLFKQAAKIDIAQFDFASEEARTATLQDIDDLLDSRSETPAAPQRCRDESVRGLIGGGNCASPSNRAANGRPKLDLLQGMAQGTAESGVKLLLIWQFPPPCTRSRIMEHGSDF